MVIRPVVSEILGGVVPPPQMLLSCQKEQMLLTVKICLVFWKSEPHYAYKRYAYKRKTCMMVMMSISDLKSESVLF